MHKVSIPPMEARDLQILTPRQRKLAAIQKVPFWWHSIDVGDGVVTPGKISMAAQELRLAAIPKRLEGMKVLDVGCWDGFYSFWCEKQGAKVIPLDNFQYVAFTKSSYGIDLQGGEGFRLAAQLLGSPLSLVQKDFVDAEGTYDIVLFLGVLYHQRNPLLALEHLHRLSDYCAVIETLYLEGEERPIMEFYLGATKNSDPTNYWGPSLRCVEHMLLDVGFRSVHSISTFKESDNRAILVAYK